MIPNNLIYREILMKILVGSKYANNRYNLHDTKANDYNSASLMPKSANESAIIVTPTEFNLGAEVFF